MDKELRKLRGYALHGDVRYKFPRRRIIVNFLGEMFASDLKQLSKEDAKINKVEYLLVVIDCFSKYLWVRALKDKNTRTVIAAFKSIIREAGGPPLTLFTDRGSEYTSDAFQKFLRENNIKWVTAYSHIKSAFAERVIRSLYSRLSRYMTEKNTRKFVEKLPDFVKSYNSTFHRTIGRAPNSVTEENANEVWEHMYRKYIEQKKRPRKPPKFKEGDLVRISSAKMTFEKGDYIIKQLIYLLGTIYNLVFDLIGYTESWSRENFRVKKVLQTYPYTYILEDLGGRKRKKPEVILGALYEPELKLGDISIHEQQAK